MASSFFGFDPSKPPKAGHNTGAPGFGPTPDAFAGFDNANSLENDESFDFDDTYDDLGAQLEETGDADNDATFGVSNVRSDFDFSGQGFLAEPTRPQQRQPQLQQQQPPPHPMQPAPPASNVRAAQRQEPSKPARTGYESYKQPGGRIADLAPSASIWGPPTKTEPKPQQQQQQQQQQHAQQQPSISTATKKMMSLEEVEAMMRQQPKKSTPQPEPTLPQQQRPDPHTQTQPAYHQQQQQQQAQMQMQQQQQQPLQPHQQQAPPQVLPGQQIQLPFHTHNQSQNQGPHFPPQGPRILSRPAQPPTHGRQPSAPREPAAMHHRGPSIGGQPVTHPSQITSLSEQERAEFYDQEANRAKRNHKIQMLSKDNGLMTPQDKNFILRIQLQQLVTATGGTDERGPEAMLAEDFYYQVYSQMRGAPGNGSISGIAQAYVNPHWQRGGSRRYPRGGDNHMRRMEQQVQRAVEAAKARPKNKQLVVEGSLGKISFSNSKTPKPLLNLKRPEGSEAPPDTGRARQQDTLAGRKAVLNDIERCYTSLMKMEDHERTMPPVPQEESPAEEIISFRDWRQKLAGFNKQLWGNLKVLEPIIPRSPVPHPFIAILSHSKGKKLIPRVFRQIDDQQRVTILTMIVVQMDMLDVIRFAQPVSGQEIPKTIKDEIELFAQAVEPSIFAYIGDAALSIVIGLVGLITDRVNIQMITQTRIGVNLLTRLISRAVMIVQGNSTDEADVEQWTSAYTRLFDVLEPYLGYLFQTPVESNEDFYVWQFLAALGIGANQEQQQRLVIGVKDRVMGSVQHAKGLSDEEESKVRLDKVNLFMRAIGLDVNLLG